MSSFVLGVPQVHLGRVRQSVPLKTSCILSAGQCVGGSRVGEYLVYEAVNQISLVSQKDWLRIF
jgi:hypothetical protein